MSEWERLIFWPAFVLVLLAGTVYEVWRVALRLLKLKPFPTRAEMAYLEELLDAIYCEGATGT